MLNRSRRMAWLKRRLWQGLELLEARQLLDAAAGSTLQNCWHDLSPAAQSNAANTLSQYPHVADDVGLRVDPQGNLFFAEEGMLNDPLPHGPGCGCAQCHGLPVAEVNLEIEPEPTSGDLPENVPLSEIPLLHSLPGATKKIYLDFNGETITGTPWNGFNQSNPIHAVPFSTDSNLTDYSASELTAIERTWQRMAEDFAPFQVDVTTEEPSAAEFAAGSTVLRVMMSTDVDDTRVGGTGYRWYSNAGGVAYVGSWSWSNAVVWVFYNNLGSSEKNMAEAGSHEAGHALGLGHDGRISPSEGYYYGHGSGDTAWAPIMGVGYNRNLSQWSKGEYLSANNTQDDLSIINSRLAYRADEDGSSAAYPRLITTSTVNANGIIATRADVDVFAFEAATGTINVGIDPATRGPNLDILAELYDVSGALVASNNPADYLYADIVTTITVPGTYYLHVSGVGKGDPLGTGYSDYGSLGQYTVTGTIPLAITPVAAPTNLTAIEISETQIQLTWTENATNETQLEVQRSVDDTNWTTIATLPADSASYLDGNLISSSRYYYRVRAKNDQSQSPFTSSLSAITQGTAPTPPSDLLGTPISGTQINLSWTDNSNNETSVAVQRSADGVNGWTTLTTLAPNATSYSSTGLSPLTTYYYRVSATNLRGTSEPSNIASATTLDGVPLAPTNFTGVLLTPTSARVQWTDNSINENDFLLEKIVYSQGGGSQAIWQTLATLPRDTTSYIDTNLTPGTYVQYRVAARNTYGASSQTYTSISVPETPPSNVVATAVSPSQINLTWTDNSLNESGFTLQRSLDGNIWSTLASLAANTVNYSDLGLVESTTYYYRLALAGGGVTGGEGGTIFYSNIASATTLSANQNPNFTSTPNFSLAENNVAVGTITAFDADPGQTLVFNLSGGADAARFTLNSITGALSFLAPPNFELPSDTNADNLYELTVSVADGAGGAANQNVLVTVTNLIEVVGTAANDAFVVSPTVNPGEVTIKNGAVTLGTFAVTDLYLDGGAGNDSLTINGTTNADDFTGSANLLAWLGFTNFHNTSIETTTVKGLAGADMFRENGGVFTFEGGTEVDRLVARNVANLWQLTNSAAGNLNALVTYSGVESLVGGTASDEFRFSGAGSVSTSIQAGDGIDILNYSTRGTPATFNLATSIFTSAGTVSGAERVIGSTGSDTLVGPNLINTWSLTGANAGTLGTLDFSAVENLTGGSQIDTFVLNAAGSISGTLNGSSGNDVLDLTAKTSPLTVDLQAKTAPGVGSLTGLERIDAPSGLGDVIRGTNNTNIWTLSGTNSGTVGVIQINGFESLLGGAGNDSFNVQPAGALPNGSIHGNGGVNTITGANATNLWSLSSAGSGSVNGLLFADAQNITGGTGIDTFNFSATGSISGTLNGNSGNDVLNLTAKTAVTIDLQNKTAPGIGSFTGLERIDAASSSGDTLIGSSANNSWTLSGNNTGVVGITQFNGFENLVGGAGNDMLTLQTSGALPSGSFAGGGGVNSITGANLATQWNISAANAGSVNGIPFTGVQNLNGGSQADYFVFQGGSVGGNIKGNAGNDVLDYASHTPGVAVNLATSQATGMASMNSLEIFRGSAGSDTLSGTNSTSTFTLSGINTGAIGTLSFLNFENLNGGTGNDTFVFQNSGSLSGAINAGAGQNMLDYKNVAANVTVDLQANTATATGGVSGFQTVRGGAGNDTLLGSTNNDMLVGMNGNDLLDGRDGHDVLFGGAGNDQLLGALGRDWLVGGAGNDSLNGGTGEDLILGGKASSFFDEASGTLYNTQIQAIMAEWTRTDATPFATRVANLQTGGGLNGTQLLTSQTDGTTSLDTLLGDLDQDWFFATSNENLTDFDSLTEVRTNV